MREVRATEAKAHFEELLRVVERGESIAIARHGKTVARLVPAVGHDRVSQKEAVERFRAWRRQRPRTGMTRRRSSPCGVRVFAGERLDRALAVPAVPEGLPLIGPHPEL